MKKPEKNEAVRNQHTFIVSGVRSWKDDNVTFNLVIDGDITIYGCRVIETQKGDFVSFPSRKGKDGKYYSHAYIRLTDEETSAIIKQVEDELNK